MNLRSLLIFLALAGTLTCIGCRNPPGRPEAGDEAKRPDQVLDFPTLYSQNCSACHGEHGRDGAAISLANPIYLSYAGLTKIEQITADGVPGTMMPPFSKHSGGMLTDRQIEVIAQGMLEQWDKNGTVAGQQTIPYTSSLKGNAERGQKAFASYCSSCHGADGGGAKAGQIQVGSIVDPAYLALVSDQGLRSIIIAGQPDQGMPGWNSYSKGNASPALSDQDVTDIVAWLGEHRSATPGQPYLKPQ